MTYLYSAFVFIHQSFIQSIYIIYTRFGMHLSLLRPRCTMP